MYVYTASGHKTTMRRVDGGMWPVCADNQVGQKGATPDSHERADLQRLAAALKPLGLAVAAASVPPHALPHALQGNEIESASNSTVLYL
jgi:hypothetical protein